MSDRRTVKIERIYDASPGEVWEMWTTVDGIESWWGPDGFGVEVHELEVSPGGKMVYSMKALEEEMKAFMVQQGMAVVTTHDVSFTEVIPYRRLAYTSTVDFIPGVDAYEVGTRLELAPKDGGTHLVLTLDAMHNDEWTGNAVAGWEQELDKLARVLEDTTR